MKLLFMELRKLADRKFLVVLVLIFAFAFGISLNGAKKYNNQVSSFNEMSLYNAQISVISATENAQSEKDADRAAYYEEEAAAYSELVTAYENKDVPAVISATLRESSNEVSSNRAGIIIDDESFNRAKKNVDICSILVKKGIKFYHLPYMEESYCDGAQAVTSFLQEYLFLLLPIVMMLLFADCLATEIRMGSIKLPLGLPYSRTRFLWNKYIAGVLLGMVALFVAGFGAFLGGTVVAGTGDIRYPILAEKSFFSVGKEGYIAEWQLWLRAGVVSFCALLFFAAFALFIGVLIRNGIFSLVFGTILAAGGVFAMRKSLMTSGGANGFLQYLPFSLTDGVAAGLGKVYQKTFSFQDDSAGLVSFVSSNTMVVKTAFSGIVFCILLILWSAAFFWLAAAIFRKKDVL